MKIKQSEIQKRFGLKPGELKNFREDKLERDAHWWKEGVQIYWTSDGVEILKQFLSGANEDISECDLPNDPQKQDEKLSDLPETLMVKVLRQMPNPTFIRVMLPNGEAALAKIHKRWSNKLVGKTVKICRVPTGNQEVIYEYCHE